MCVRPQVDAKALRKAIKRRVPYLDQHRECVAGSAAEAGPHS
jgi:hypothetical protein